MTVMSGCSRAMRRFRLNFKIAETHETHETHKYRHVYIHIKKK